MSRGMLPRGCRDLLPSACRRRRAMTAALLAAFERWGFEPVITPSVEYFDELAKGLAASEKRLCVRFIEPGSGELVALRSDITAQVARMVSGRSDDELPGDATLRLAYAGDVVRQWNDARAQTEVHQVGAELIGDASAHADAELLAVCHAGLLAAGLSDFRFDVSHRRIGRTLIEGLQLPAEKAAAVHEAILRRDADAAAALLGAQHSTVPELCHLYGPSTILAKARDVLGPSVAPGLDQLEAVLAALHEVSAEAAEKVVVDLGELRGFDYYTGLRIRVWAPGVAKPIVRGGRYDALLGNYGAPRPATGFAVDLDALDAAVSANPLEHRPAATLVAIDPSTSGDAARRLAATVAAQARAQGRRAWVQPSLPRPRAEALAHEAAADRLAMITGSRGDPQATTIELEEKGHR